MHYEFYEEQCPKGVCSILTKGRSTKAGKHGINSGRNDTIFWTLGDQDIYNEDFQPSTDVDNRLIWEGSCGVIYHGQIHLFGGGDYGKQHLGLVGREIKKYDDLSVGFDRHACNVF